MDPTERDPLAGSSEQYTYLGDFLRPDNGSNTVGYITRGAECGHVEFSECHLRVVQPTCKVDFLMSLLKTWKDTRLGEFISRLRCSLKVIPNGESCIPWPWSRF